MSGDPKMLTREVLQMLRGSSLDIEEISAIVERRIEDRDRRLVAERDGWRRIAIELLQVAGLPADGDIPPIEIVDLRETRSLPRRNVAQLEQFWADLTRKHEERRAQARERHIEEQMDSASLDGDLPDSEER